MVLAGPAAADCRLALVLAVDISSSVDAEEDRLQRQGLARALTSERVRRAALALPGQHVALAVFEWSGRWQQETLLEWTPLRSAADIDAAAAAIAGSTRSYADFPTAAGYALGYASEMLGRAPDCLFRTIDISGDGVSNEGFPPSFAYSNFPLGDVTVNGLAITGHDETVVRFYRTQIVRGPGAFLEIADDFPDFERAMTRKLEREMGARVVGSSGDGPRVQ
ncbi:DUF1194 domain-containing protein [Palleronia sediminis]|uniref:DUF1194 domain-containing protein n=1 Tax=Palleronia sediminis TaxID=2547833 RepID=A0A4R6AG33_9RHOB|nr:DUF1194 domain-containing protein [Palleronia sediminis]